MIEGLVTSVHAKQIGFIGNPGVIFACYQRGEGKGKIKQGMQINSQ